jgi:hypothetical protein
MVCSTIHSDSQNYKLWAYTRYQLEYSHTVDVRRDLPFAVKAKALHRNHVLVSWSLISKNWPKKLVNELGEVPVDITRVPACQATVTKMITIASLQSIVPLILYLMQNLVSGLRHVIRHRTNGNSGYVLRVRIFALRETALLLLSLARERGTTCSSDYVITVLLASGRLPVVLSFRVPTTTYLLVRLLTETVEILCWVYTN